MVRVRVYIPDTSAFRNFRELRLFPPFRYPCRAGRRADCHRAVKKRYCNFTVFPSGLPILSQIAYKFAQMLDWLYNFRSRRLRTIPLAGLSQPRSADGIRPA
jgi:hypothetical protein